jgi:hypothetical protein
MLVADEQGVVIQRDCAKAMELLPMVEGKAEPARRDASTVGLLKAIYRLRARRVKGRGARANCQIVLQASPFCGCDICGDHALPQVANPNIGLIEGFPRLLPLENQGNCRAEATVQSAYRGAVARAQVE